MDELIVNQANDLCLILCDDELTVCQLIAIRNIAAVQISLTGFLPAALDCLNKNVFALDLSSNRQHGDHEPAAVFGAVDSVLHTDQVHAAVLHTLQGVKHIRALRLKRNSLNTSTNSTPSFPVSMSLSIRRDEQHPIR